MHAQPLSYYTQLLPPAQEAGGAIPQRLHQIYIGGSLATLAPEMQANVQHLQQLHPNWDYQLWDEAKLLPFIREVYGEEVLRIYQLISPRYRAAQADLARYLIIYHYGGCYLDIKASFTRPLDEVLDLEHDRYLIFNWDNDPGRLYEGFGFLKELPRSSFPHGEYLQGFIISSPHHPILRAVIAEALYRLEHYSPFRAGVGLYGVLRTTGPVMYSQTIDAQKRLLPQDSYRQVRCIEELGGRISIYDKDGAFAHRKKLSNYHNQLSAISLNGSQHYTRLLYPFFWGYRVLCILGDKYRQRLGKTKESPQE